MPRRNTVHNALIKLVEDYNERLTHLYNARQTIDTQITVVMELRDAVQEQIAINDAKDHKDD